MSFYVGISPFAKSTSTNIIIIIFVYAALIGEILEGGDTDIITGVRVVDKSKEGPRGVAVQYRIELWTSSGDSELIKKLKAKLEELFSTIRNGSVSGVPEFVWKSHSFG